MKLILTSFILSGLLAFTSCQNAESDLSTTDDSSSALKEGGQSSVVDTTSSPNVVRVAVSSKDHTTLVKALGAADLVNALSNNGPFTVFAPTDAAFALLPVGTLDELLKPERKVDLQNILQYHVWIGVLNENMLKDGEVLNMVNMGNATIHAKDGKFMINDANIVGSVKATNGIVYVIDKVLLPPSEK